MEEIDGAIPAIEQRVENLTNELNNGSVDHNELTTIASEIQKLKDQLDELGSRWLELMEIKGA